MRSHGFTNVDEQDDPTAWIGVLGAVRQHPAYAAYKRRIAELLEPRPGGRYLDVGVGSGVDALALAARFGVDVGGVDVSRTMIDEARRRGLANALVAEAGSLPFEDETFDGCWADRTFQHLADPRAALAEMVRVTKPGGRIVVADPDYDTQVVEIDDQALARRVLRYRADHLLRNGTIAHRTAGLFVRAGLADVSVEGVSVVLRDPAALDNAMGLRSWAETAMEDGLLVEADVHAWERGIDDAIAGSRFLYAFTVFITTGARGAAGG
jgi:SAM-dependent methyltransferase